MIDRASIERRAHDLVHETVQRGTPPGASLVIEGAAGIGKTFLARRILDSLPPGAARIIYLTAEQGRRHEPLAAAAGLLDDGHGPAPPPASTDAAFDRVDELCAAGPVVLCADDAHYLDAATLTLLRRLVWASRSLPLAVVITTRPYPSRASLALLVRQAQDRVSLPPMGRMMIERLVFDQTGRWPGPVLRGVLELAAGHPLFASELLRAYQDAGALAETGPDTVEARFELGLQATGLDEVIRAHLGQLDQPARGLVAALAVWGADITEAELVRLLAAPQTDQTDQPDLSEPLEQTIVSGLVRREPSGAVGFTHDLFREVAYGELPEAQRRALHQRAAQLLSEAGYRPALVADHLLRAGGAAADPALGAALHEAVAATRGYAPEVTADLLDEVTAVSGPDVPEPMLLDHVLALFRHGRAENAEAVIRARIATITSPSVAAQLQLTLIRSLINRADMPAALAAIAATLAVPGLPGPAAHDLQAVRAWLLTMAGEPPPAADQSALLARIAAAGDVDAQASMVSTMACLAFLDGDPDQALALMRDREALLPGASEFRSQSSALVLPVQFVLAAAGPLAAQPVLDRARRLSAEHDAAWIDPYLGFAAGGIAFAAGDWDGAVAELDAALEQAEEAGSGWISLAVGVRAYIDAHRSRRGPARARLESFRHRGLPFQFGHDRPGWAELAVLEADGAVREADTLARTLWSRAGRHPAGWAGELAVDATRVALAAMDQRLAGQLHDDAPARCAPHLAQLVRATIDTDPDAIDAAAGELAAAGRRTLEAFAREELACAAAATGDRDRATQALDAALAGYRRMGATADRDRALQRLRALGIRRGPRVAHAGTDSGWAALTPTEARIAVLVREGLTNREIGTRLFVSPRTVQTHVSHILQKTGLRSRVEVARAAGEQLRRLADVSVAGST